MKSALVALYISLSLLATAQTLKPRLGQSVRSPEVDSAGRVTFRFKAPNAKSVGMFSEALSTMKMTKDDQGVWSVTTPPLDPDFYSYQFFVDGTVIADPSNTLMKSVATGGSESIVHVPGPPTLSWEENDVPHGTLRFHTYLSRTVGERRRYVVYAPPNYNPVAKIEYPVLYLLHGVMEDETAWFSVGRVNVILDNLIASHKAKPMLVVMPLGYGFPNAADRMGEQFGLANQQPFMDVFAKTLFQEIMPRVDADYHVSHKPQGRAIAGASMGGAQALYMGLNRPDRFAYIGAFSAATIMYGGDLPRWFPSVSAALNSKVKLVTVDCGTADFLLTSNRKTKDWLKGKGLAFLSMETPGGHTWNVWRRNLTELLPQLFK